MPNAPKKLPSLRDSKNPEQVDIFQREVREQFRRLNDAIDDLVENGTEGGVTSVTAGSANVTVAPTTGDVVVDVDLSGVASLSHTHVKADVTDFAHTHPESDITNLVSDLAAKVPVTRTISTTAPLTGGGDLSANRTLAIDVFTDTVKGAVPAPNNGGDSSTFLAADGTWIDPSATIDGFFGTGDDGDVTISVDSTIARDMFYNNLTIDSGVTLNPSGFKIFVKGTLALNGKIARNGNNGQDGPALGSGSTGGAALAAGSLPGSTAGGNGGAQGNGIGDPGGGSTVRYAGLGTGTPTGAGGAGQGAAGGANSSGTAGGTGGPCTEAGATSGNTLYNLWQAINGRSSSATVFTGATGGGGGRGGGAGGSGSAGAGGSGGGYVVVVARAITGSGVIEAKGGNGGATRVSLPSDGGGGGGGGGGTIVVVLGSSGPFPSMDVSGGSGGTAVNGVSGYAGGTGHTETYRLLTAGGGGSGVVADGDYGDIVVSSSGGAWVIDANAVTTSKILANNVTLEKLAQIATARFLGRATASTGDVEALTGTQATALLDTFTTSAKGLVPAASGGNTTTEFLRKDGSWQVPGGGGSGGWTTVGSTTLASAANTITVSGLDGDTDGYYEIEFNYVASGTSAHDIDIRPNGVTTSDRATVRKPIDGSSFTTATGIVVANGGVTNVMQARGKITAHVARSPGGVNYYRRFYTEMLLSWNNGANAGRWDASTVYSSTASNLTSITVGITNINFAAGSQLIVKKRA